MANFDLFFPILLQNEGFYSNAKDDTGGETWEGISRNNFPTWPGWTIVDSYKSNENFPHILRADTHLAGLVKSFYKPTFWDAIQGDNMSNQSLCNFLADWGVNGGVMVPIKHVQSILMLQVDGIVGPETLSAINGNSNEVFFNTIKAARLQFYHDVEVAHPSDSQFLSNWTERTNSFSFSS